MMRVRDIRRPLAERSRRARGRILVGVGSLTVLLGAAVTVAVATRSLALSEAQRAADAGALAGAGTLLSSPHDPLPATAAAIRFTRLNRVLGRAPRVHPEDIEVNVDSGSVRVRVHATVYVIPHALAWILGKGEVSVTAVATAEARSPDSGRPPKVLRLIE